MRSSAAAASEGCVVRTRRPAAAWIPIAATSPASVSWSSRASAEAEGRAVGLGAREGPFLHGAPPARDEPDHEAEPEAEREATQDRVPGRPPLPQGDAQDERAGTRADRDLRDGGVRSPPRRQPPAEPRHDPVPMDAKPSRQRHARIAPSATRSAATTASTSPMSVRIRTGQPAPRNEGIVSTMATGTTTSR